MEHWWGGGEGLLLQLLEAILAWRKMSNLTTAHWKCWSCQYQWSSSTEGQTPNCPGFSWTILIVVSMFSGFPSAGAGIYTTEGSVNNSRASSNYLSHHPTFPALPSTSPLHSAQSCASYLKSGNPLKTLLYEPFYLDSGGFLSSILWSILFLKGRLNAQWLWLHSTKVPNDLYWKTIWVLRKPPGWWCCCCLFFLEA